MFPTAVGLALALAAGPATPAPRAQDPAPAKTVLVLTVEEAVQRALENNADLAVERFSPESALLAISDAESVYAPVVFSNISTQSRTSKATNSFAGADKVDNDTLTYNFGASKLLPTGGSLRADFNNNRATTNSIFSTFNPTFNSAFQVNFTQPLLRNRSIDSNRLNLRLSKRNRDISDLQFRSIVVSTLANVRKLYYDLIYAGENLGAQRKSLALAQKFLNENQIKVNVGTLAPLDVVAAESEVATREEGVVIAENALAEAQDALKRVIFPANDPESWRTEIVAKDRPTADPVAADADVAIANALSRRIDFAVAKKNFENIQDQLELARQGTKPTLDLVANYGTIGTGGTQRRDLLSGDILTSPIVGGYGDSLSELLGRDFPTWSVGVNFSYPIGNKAAKNSAARAQIASDQYSALLRRAELQIASEVRTAARAVETNFKRVATTRSARTLQLRRLDAEEKKFAAGMSTNFLVTQAQRDLALAEVAELRAISDYNKSIVDFERVQEAGLSGGNGTISIR
ncbi:MAG: TolC family protein [Vicinamibacteria bacterium]|jgi:outer membrane protein|nr:TolC family protein [Vicinamibacteria bacterium]MBP9945343.1 TolC family protein [Vicinamibacteria bacterium]